MSRKSLNNVAKLIDVNKKQEQVEERFRFDLIRSIEIDNGKQGRPPSRTFKPSSMNCKRNSYYQIMGVDTEPSDSPYNMKGITDSGSDIHEHTQKAISNMKENGIDCEYINVADFVANRCLTDVIVREQKGMETKLYNQKYNISFMCDGIIRYRGKYYILEIKTETSHKWYARNGVDPKHYKQATAYSLSLELSDVIFLYIDRDMLQFKTFMFPVTPDMLDSMVEYITDTQSYVDKKIVPPKEDVGRNICQYCGYKSRCRKDS